MINNIAPNHAEIKGCKSPRLHHKGSRSCKGQMERSSGCFGLRQGMDIGEGAHSAPFPDLDLAK